MRSWTTESTEETIRLGESLASELVPEGLLLLIGDMGSGKTVLTRGIAQGLGIEPSEVQSPTYVLIREHTGQHVNLLHVDLYRLDRAEVDALGLDEIFSEPAVKVVEWADRLPHLPDGALVLELSRGVGPSELGGRWRTIRERNVATMASIEAGT